MTTCPCGLQDYADCCGLYHIGMHNPPTPEVLMRSRYSAYALANMEYIKRTMFGKPLAGFDELQAKMWAESIEWLKLKIIHSEIASAGRGFVEFIAYFIENNKRQSLHELSEFQLIEGQWYYVNGTYPQPNKKISSMKIGRNDPCPCGSRKKFKNCHDKQPTSAK